MEPIKKGLKCWLEGVDVTNSSTTWKDRSGNNNNFSITGSLTTEKNMAIFSGSQYAKISNLNIEHGTIEITVAYDSGGTSSHGFGSWESNKYKFTFGSYSIHMRKKSNPVSGAGSWDFRTSQNIKYGDVATYGLSYNESTFSIFYNGKIISEGVSSEIPNITSFYLGLKSDDNTKHAGKIKSLRIYNRKLEYHEILANYQYELLDRNNNLYVNNNNLPKIVEKLSDASNIKITGNEYGNRVQTVIDKIVEKADNVTKAINQEVINNTHSFKVGTGNNINVSSDVQDSFSEITIKGQTYQNLVDKKTYVANNTLTNSTSNGIIYGLANKLKPNTVYTIFYKIKANQAFNVTALSSMFRIDIYYDDGTSAMSYGFKGQLTDSFKTVCEKFTMPSKNSITKIELNLRNAYNDYNLESNTLTIKEVAILEGDYTDNPNLPSYFEGIVGVGDKSKNLFNKDNIKQTVLNLGAVGSNCDEVFSQVRCSLRKISCKPNTKYTIKSDKEISVAIGSIGNNNIALGDSNWRNIYNSYTYTTPSDAIELAVNIAKTDNTNIDIDYVKNFNIQIEEGETSTSYEPYYDGHKIEILSSGKNLYNIHNDITLTYGISKIEEGTITTKTLDSYGTFGLVNSLHNVNSRIFNKPTKIVKGKKYSISCKARRISGEGNLNYFAIFGFKKDKNSYINTGISYSNLWDINLSTDWLELKYSNVATDDFDTVCPCFQVPSSAYNLILEIKDIQIEEVDTSTSYEPYVSDKAQILLDEPLMRLPNGVCDEITRDGKLIRRVGKVVLDGRESWKAYADKEDCWMFAIDRYPSNLKHRLYENTNLICDITPIGNLNIEKKQRSIFVYGHAANNELRYAIPKTILAGNGTHLFKQWLQANPTTVYYELATPIITELPAPYLRIFKDGRLTFNTLVAPESNHVVQLNKSEQIQNAIKESQSLNNRINVLENNYDNLMLSTISRLNDLELDYTLK